MKALKKYFAMLASAGFVMAAAATSQAQFASKGTQVLSASAQMTGTTNISINSIALKNLSDNSTVPTSNGLGWTNPGPGAGFLVSDQYIQMVSNINTVDGGIQIYTDNTNTVANPKYTGLVSSYTATPAGLVGVTLTDQKLPTAWRASTGTIAGLVGSGPGVDPNNAVDPNHFLWLYHEDKAQVAVPASSAAVFGNGDPYITVYASPGTPLVSQADLRTYTTTSSNSGLHFAQGPTQFGGYTSGNATTDIYTEADFTGALAGQTYSTNRLILEAFSL